MANLQSHKLQLHPTKNASGGVYDPTNGNDGTNVIVKHNALIDSVESNLTTLETKVMSFFFPVLVAGQMLIPDNFGDVPITIKKLKTFASTTNGTFSLAKSNYDYSQLIITNGSLVNYNALLGYTDWMTHIIVDNPILDISDTLNISSANNANDVVMHIYYI